MERRGKREWSAILRPSSISVCPCGKMSPHHTELTLLARPSESPAEVDMLVHRVRAASVSLVTKGLRVVSRTALPLAQAQVGPETGGHLNAAPRTNDSTRIARNR